MIIQGASKLIKLIRDRELTETATDEKTPTTLEGLTDEVHRLEGRLNENSKSDVEQIRLIEELAKQNEGLAATLEQTLKRVNRLTYIAIIALGASAVMLVYLVFIR
jgi:hypothetical protein